MYTYNNSPDFLPRWSSIHLLNTFSDSQAALISKNRFMTIWSCISPTKPNTVVFAFRAFFFGVNIGSILSVDNLLLIFELNVFIY